MGFDVKFPGDTGGDMTAAASYRHPAVGNIRHNDDNRPKMHQASPAFVFKIKNPQTAFAACQAQGPPPAFPGINVIIN